jgi:hypothetical protein
MRNLIKMRLPIAATILGGALIVSASIISAAPTTHTPGFAMPEVYTRPTPDPHPCPAGQLWLDSGANAWSGRCDYPTVNVAP